jgi:hypothetical protein
MTKQEAINNLKNLHMEVKATGVSEETKQEMTLTIAETIERIGRIEVITLLTQIRLETQLETITSIWNNIKELQTA